MRDHAIFGFLAIAAVSFGQVYMIDTVAGSGWNGDGGSAAVALLRQPQGVAADFEGNVYIAEAGAHRVRKISPSGVITTFAGTGTKGFSGDEGPAVAAQLDSPYGLAVNERGDVFIADLGNARVRRVSPDGTITTIAGGGSGGVSWKGGNRITHIAKDIALSAPRNVACMGGHVFVSDFAAHRVYRIDDAGAITALAGTGNAGYSGDGDAAVNARLAYPAGITADHTGVYIADSQNGVIRRVADGLITTVAHANTPTAVAFDAGGVLHVTEAATGNLVRLPKNGSPTVEMRGATDVALAHDSSLWVTDANRGLAWVLTARSERSLGAGNGKSFHGDGGPARDALLNQPTGGAMDGVGNLYIADRGNRRVRRAAPDGTIVTLAGGAQTDPLEPSAVVVDGAGNVYVSDTGHHQVRLITPSGVMLVVAGTGVAGKGGEGQLALESALHAPGGLTLDGFGSLYFADTGNGRLRKADARGVVTTLIGDLGGPRGVAYRRAPGQPDQLYFTEEDAARVGRMDLGTGQITYLAPGLWTIPRGIAVNTNGDVFVVDTGRHQVLRLHADGIGTGEVIAGTGAPGFSGDNGPAIGAQLNFPWDVALGPDGTLYVADAENHRIRRLTPNSLTVLNGASLAPGMPVSLAVRGLNVAGAASVTVFFNAIEVRVIGVQDSSGDGLQIDVEAPADLSSDGGVEIVILQEGKIIASLRMER